LTFGHPSRYPSVINDTPLIYFWRLTSNVFICIIVFQINMITYAIRPIFRIKHALVDYIILILVTYEPWYQCLTLDHPSRYPSLIDRTTLLYFQQLTWNVVLSTVFFKLPSSLMQLHPYTFVDYIMLIWVTYEP